MESAFGVDHGEIYKGRGFGEAGMSIRRPKNVKGTLKELKLSAQMFAKPNKRTVAAAVGGK